MKKEDTFTTELAAAEETALVQQNAPLGFDEDSSEDLIIPRIKVINALSPERMDGAAEEGQLLNSLTGEDVAGKRFIPIKQYYSNIEWNPDRNAEVRIFCRSFDGRIGQNDEGSIACSQCCKNKFDNNKVGKDSQPLCTQYLNFLGFIEGNPMPVVLSFARTNYNEGKKVLSIAKSMRQAIWNYAYILNGKQVTKDRNKWYIITAQMAGETSAEERTMAAELFRAYENANIAADLEENAPVASRTVDAETEAEL